MKNAQKIGLFGGSFDPVHNGHMALAEAAKKELGLGKVVFIPAKIPPHKLSKQPAPAGLRLKMLRAAIKDRKGFILSRYELDRRPPTYTYQTVSMFKRLYPGSKLFFIIGADSLVELKTWKNISKLVRMAQFVSAKRRGVRVSPKTPFHRSVLMLKGVPPAVSSSQIRALAGRGRPVKGLVPPAVEKMITKGGIYNGISGR